MARNLGQAVALQRLAIDEKAIVTIPLAKPEASVMQEHEQNAEQRPVRDRKQVSQGQEHGRFARPKHVSQTAFGTERRQNDGATSRRPSRQPEGFSLPERPYSSQVRDSRRVAEKQFGFGRTTDKHRARSFNKAAAPQHPIARRKPRAAPAAQARRASSNRF